MAKKKKCKHIYDWEEPCPYCGYQEGVCKKCKRYVCRQGNRKVEEL